VQIDILAVMYVILWRTRYYKKVKKKFEEKQSRCSDVFTSAKTMPMKIQSLSGLHSQSLLVASQRKKDIMICRAFFERVQLAQEPSGRKIMTYGLSFESEGYEYTTSPEV